MSARYVCPNDGEVLNVTIDSSASQSAESYQCAFCHYKSTKVNAISKLTVVDETYVPPSKSKPK